MSVNRLQGGYQARCRTTEQDLERVVECFAMPAFDEDNHHPGVARHLWCPIEEQYRSACECKVHEVTIVDGEYRWTNDVTDACRGCELRTLSGLPCPLHDTADLLRRES